MVGNSVAAGNRGANQDSIINGLVDMGVDAVGAVTERLDISLEEAKAYFRVDSDVEDEVIADCVDAAKSESASQFCTCCDT